MDKKMLHWIDRAGDRMGALADLAAGALGTYWRMWMRLFAYAMAGLLAGIAVGDPYRTMTTVLICSVVVEFGIALMTYFVDTKAVIATFYILVIWPLRDNPRALEIHRTLFSAELDTTDREAARAALLESVR